MDFDDYVREDKNSTKNIKKEKGLSIEECVKKADEYIKKNGACLLLLDVKGSKNYHPRNALTDIMKKMASELNEKFDQYLPEHSLEVSIRTDKGFHITLGDAFCAGINDSFVIKETEKYLKDNYPKVVFYWGIAEDGWDREGLEVVR